MKPFTILYHYSNSKVDTGSPRALLRMIESLDRARFRPVFVGPVADPLASELRSLNVDAIDCDVESVSLRAPCKAFRQIRSKLLLVQRTGASVVHLNEPGWNSDLVIAAALARIPVALHLHNPQTISRRNLNFAIAHTVFLCSKGQIGDIVNFGRIEDKHFVLHNAVDIAHFAQGHSIRTELGLTSGEAVIGTVAQIGYRKGIDIFLDAGRRLLENGRAIKLVIVGPPAIREDEYFQSIMQESQRGSLKGNVIYLGSRDDIPDVLASLDIFCLATRAEPFGMVVIEAMAAGVPVVVSRIGGIPEIVLNDEIGRTVSPLSGDAFATALDQVLRMERGRSMLGERGRQSLYGRFDLQHMGDVLGKVYQDMTHGRRSSYARGTTQGA